MIYHDYYLDVCPICGNKIIHEHTGRLTQEQERENWDCCLWMECIDEGRSTIGYTPICKKGWQKYDELF